MLHGRLFVATPTELHAAYVQFFVYSLYLGKLEGRGKGGGGITPLTRMLPLLLFNEDAQRDSGIIEICYIKNY